MTPSLFACASEPKKSELDVAKGWGGNASHVLARHWDEWIVEEDFKWLAEVGQYAFSPLRITHSGVNTLRLPIG